jgi:hypothetical protein
VTRRCLICAVASEGGVVVACAGGGPLRGEAELAVAVGDVDGVAGGADAVELVPYRHRLPCENLCAALGGGGDGDLLADVHGGL